MPARFSRHEPHQNNLSWALSLELVVPVVSVSPCWWVSEGRMCMAKLVVSELGGPSATLTGQEGKYLIFQASILANLLSFLFSDIFLMQNVPKVQTLLIVKTPIANTASISSRVIAEKVHGGHGVPSPCVSTFPASTFRIFNIMLQVFPMSTCYVSQYVDFIT